MEKYIEMLLYSTFRQYLPPAVHYTQWTRRYSHPCTLLGVISSHGLSLCPCAIGSSARCLTRNPVEDKVPHISEAQ